MKKILFIIFLITFVTIGYSQKKQCSDFKTGKFEYTDSKYFEWKVVRTDSTQTEINSKNGIELKATILWKSDCAYVLTYEKITNSDLKDLIGKKVFVEILEIQNQKFKYHSKMEALEITSEMIKVE
ncbi:MAG: hypothetical protein PHC28_05710 [Flavobacterium sp.]|uniref:hypothetical protein n=1 Tax=Flavobacterium sp. TaxID=239 RepID=UPI0026227A4B|nr:hypothetical protein [Flavobacterium sp.]MDD5149965.1 hypothetical protein [Flavobacterium sp.]